MCLSTVYRGSVEQDNMLMKNVATIEYRDGNIVLTDLMERQLSFEGELVMANLVEGVAVVREKAVQ
ncbi:MAG: CooT family nickel-binding protein [Butyricicoccus sp.]|nr:CooT family nickel-binding protein [Butyricicoccus sp.]